MCPIRNWHDQWLLLMMAICFHQETNYILCSRMKLMLQCFSLFQLETLHGCVCSSTTTFQGTQWKYCAQVQYLSWNHRADFLMFHWTSPVLRRDLRQDRNGESCCSSKCKEKEFTLRRELLNNLLKKLLIHRNISDQISHFITPWLHKGYKIHPFTTVRGKIWDEAAHTSIVLFKGSLLVLHVNMALSCSCN